ncbi:OLC1v1039124C1 [Oldenlandia corymbosa var. corymbosa]|uniref:OLC1v1039124C1 n=1 Tax=Oldenlandia corymbosa var. corymbosa TaxID=529605 RepID=A0AAV1D2E1_OLDCO|nr:OLC1v1039124C1 [Oldenlandia corymbosa var. corymbosa]
MGATDKDERPFNFAGDDDLPSDADEHPTVSKDIVSDALLMVRAFFADVRFSSAIPAHLNSTDSYSDFFRHFLKVRSIKPGKISCLLVVKPPILNLYGGMHGGAVAAVSELMATACARTVVGKEKDVFLGELSTSYLSAAPSESKVIVDGSVVRSGRSLTVVAIEFKLEESGKLVYTSRATLYHLPPASL